MLTVIEAAKDQNPEREGSAATNHGDAGSTKRLAIAVSFAVPAALVAALIVALIFVRDGAEAVVANVASLLPLGYAFGAGMVASVNPCGFMLLPSYISYQLGAEDPGFDELSVASRVARALLLAVLATAGFLAVFAIVGSLVAVGGSWLMNFFPYAGIVIGAAMILLGLWLLLTHRTFGLLAATRVSVRPKRTLRGGFLFGVAYAVSSLGCTLPIFLVVVGSALASESLLSSLGQFVGYALGMGTIFVGVAMGGALFREALSRWLRAAIPYLHKVSALFLVGAGVYLILYWTLYSGLLS